MSACCIVQHSNSAQTVLQPSRSSVDSNGGHAAVARVLLSADALFLLCGRVHCDDLPILHSTHGTSGEWRSKVTMLLLINL